MPQATSMCTIHGTAAARSCSSRLDTRAPTHNQPVAHAQVDGRLLQSGVHQQRQQAVLRQVRNGLGRDVWLVRRGLAPAVVGTQEGGVNALTMRAKQLPKSATQCVVQAAGRQPQLWATVLPNTTCRHTLNACCNPSRD